MNKMMCHDGKAQTTHGTTSERNTTNIKTFAGVITTVMRRTSNTIMAATAATATIVQ
jgi:hypothetical protein